MSVTMEMYQPTVIQPVPLQQTVVQVPATQVVYAETRPQDHFSCALFTCLCCFFPTGIAALIFSRQVSPRWNDGDIAGAKSSSSTADMFWKISLGIGTFVWIGIAIGIFFGVLVPIIFVYGLFG